MKRIDLHIHTLNTLSDNTEFDFSLSFLQNYIEYSRLDAIAITNHNIFDMAQFEEISKNIDIVVFPGVEVDIAKGHLLVISPIERVLEFNEQCAKLTPLIINQDSTIDLDTFREIFPNYDEYLLIPHYDKKPKLNMSIIKDLGGIVSGEVQSLKKFFYMKNDQDSLTPLIFSDLRMYDRVEDDEFHLPTRFTYMDINNVEITSIKLALQDKHKIKITEKDSNEIFDIVPNKIQASTKLNLIIGKRSTGKTYTLEKIVSTLQDNDYNNVKYIKQFQIVNESEDKSFDKIKNEEKKAMLHDYLEPIKKVIKIVMSIDINKVDEDMKRYIETLSSYADNQALNDEYSKCILFSETKYNAAEPKKILKLADSSYTLLSELENEYADSIRRHISIQSLLNLTREMVNIYENEFKEYKLKNKADEIIIPIKKELGEQSAIDPIEDTDFSDFFIKYKIVEQFNNLIKRLNTKKEINRKDLYRFEAILKKMPFSAASDLNKEIGGNGYSSALALYKNERYYSYLKELIKSNVDVELLHYSLFNCTLEICNKHDTPISHGERAEYNLLRNIEDAYNFDALLLDEPEASFDNEFIHGFVITKIKELSEKITVFVVTHNNTLGSSLMPDHVIHTYFDEDKYITKDYSKEECFEVYSGSFDSKSLLSSKGRIKTNYNVLMDTMEAGENAYKRRREIYDNLKNK